MREIAELKKKSRQMRLDILRLTYQAGKKGAHIAPSLSMVEIMAVLFTIVMEHKKDVFVLSKGHGALCYYTAMMDSGLITREQMDSFEENGGDFPGQPSRSMENKIQFSSGSLGLGLSYACGLACQAKYEQSAKQIYVLMGDGELNEGSVWEAVMFANQKKLNNITAIVDWNEMQSDGFSKNILMLDLEKMWAACGWEVVCCDGHDEAELIKAFANKTTEKPKVVLAHTVKGKGISFMENNRIWHHNHLNESQYHRAIEELEAH